ncbi:hypothetical protein JO972_02215 [Verrucomicrobiaceae bacterium 5K15]|uniref:Uncharacterized protein n=1 Tax=Oceaniferula flava TaxID=2800421 RepID=A0AAE2S9F8_9BACT|nr:hypothetical protein [Oceaniferula flavus]MBK1853760.1 hypothetical protein [Oceaniferula flavus]MBM1135067.1 hypothetical protein [Oceaniferula flavus]
MKLTSTLAALASLSFAFVSCDDKKTDTDPHAGHDHGAEEHKAPVPHDHDGDGVPDHGPGAHGDHHGHDHDHDHGDHEGHSHEEKPAGPNGGRIITGPDFHAEFLITKDKKVQITFLNAENQAIAPKNQTVSVICGDRSNPTTLNPTKKGDSNVLVSSATIPEGNNFPTIVTVQTTSDAQPVRAKFMLNMSDCSSCGHQEYACTCAH